MNIQNTCRHGLLSRLVCAALVLCLLSFALVPVQVSATKVSCAEYSGSNQLSDYHARWGSPVRSHLINVDGGLLRFQADASNEGYLVEYYDSNYNFLRSLTVSTELPIYGGFYASGSHYYILSGQTNHEESAEVECFRITKYDLNWNRLGSTGLYDCNTTVPFDAGSARFAMTGKYLLIRTAHEMYTSSDGLNHQANVTIQVDTETMTITDSFCRVMNNSYGYVSHSFNQFIQIENNKIVAVDHGDAHPRSIALLQYQTDVSSGKFVPSYGKYCTVTDLQKFPGATGANTTNASVGGFEISDSSYLVAYNYVVNYVEGLSYAQEIRATRNVFIASMDKQTSKVTLKQITNYADGETTASVPHLVKLSDDRFLLLWEQGDHVHYTLLDAAGNPIGQIRTMENAALSDCVPVVHEGKAVWYVWNDSQVIVYEIDLNDLSGRQAAELTYGHDFTIPSYPTEVGGDCTRVCQSCGHSETGSTPSSLELWWQIGGTGSYWSRPLRTTFDVGEQLAVWIIPAAADFDDVTVTVSDPSGMDIKWENGDCVFTFKKPGTYDITVSCTYNPLLTKTQTVTVAHTDADSNNLCDGCGAQIATITRKGCTLSYEDLIYVIGIFDLTGVEGVDLTKDAGMLIWSVEEYEALSEIAFDADHAKVGLTPYKTTGYYSGASDGIFTRDLYKEAYYVGYVKLADGSYIYTDAKLYSPSIYAYNMLAKENSKQETKDLCVALLNYISAAQRFFDKNTPAEDLVNYDLTDAQKALNWENISFNLAPEVPTGKQVERDYDVFTTLGKNLLFEEMISLTAIYKIDDNTVANARECGTIFWTAEQFAAVQGVPSINNYGSGTKIGLSQYRGNVGQWCSHAPKVAAKDMAETQYYCLGYVVHADGSISYSGVQSYTVEQYIFNTVGKASASPEMRALAQRLYYYERAAEAALG